MKLLSTLLQRRAEQDWKPRVRVAPEKVALFVRQLSVMLHAGVPLVVSLDTLSVQPESPAFERAIREISEKVGQGYPLSRMLSQFPGLFSHIHIAMVASGEQTGGLVSSLDRLATWGERDGKLRSRLKAAFTYPLVVFCIACLLCITLFMTVVPGFVEMFESNGMELPLLTRIIVFITHLVTSPSFWVVSLIGSTLIYSQMGRFLRTDQGAQIAFRLCTHVPLVGGLLVYAGLARYIGVLGTLVDAGLDLMRGLRLAGQASGNPLLAADSQRLVTIIREGESLSQAMDLRDDLYLSAVRQMVLAGEESSNLASMCHNLSRLYDEEVLHKVDAFGAALEPLMLGFVSLVVGSIVLSIILPLYGLLNQLGL